MPPLTYKKSGVDIDAAGALIRRIKPFIKKTEGPEVLSSIGHYAGLFGIDPGKYLEPVLVASTDGVGTKLKLALQCNKLEGLGQDLVAMSANDILCLGAKPLFFLDYFATGRLEVGRASLIIRGVAEACREIGCALLGGETAEMPGIYRRGDFDLAGFIVGVVEKGEIIDGSRIEAGDRIIGIASSGFHSNGFSLVRKVIQVKKLSLRKKYPPLRRPLGETLLEPTRLYVNTVLDLKGTFQIRGLAHITGGGLLENLPRIFPDRLKAVLHRDRWPLPPLFQLFQKWGRISDREMYRVFNCGIGLVLIVPPAQENDMMRQLSGRGEKAWVIGEMTERKTGKESIQIL